MHTGRVITAANVKRALDHPLGAPLRLAHRTSVWSLHSGSAALARARVEAPHDPEWLAERLTLCAKTFERPATARRLVRSARRVFAGQVILADDSARPMQAPDGRTEVIDLPFNSGVPHGRNAALARVRTPYAWVSDDDVVFTRDSRVRSAVEFLEAHPDVDAVCATQIELPRLYIIGYGPDSLFLQHRPPLRPFGSEIDGLPVVLMGPPVYVGRTESLLKVPYDERIRMVEHRDFFSMASGTLVFVQDPAFVVLHARTPFNKRYTSFRNDVAGDLAYLGRKWSGTSAEGGRDPAVE